MATLLQEIWKITFHQLMKRTILLLFLSASILLAALTYRARPVLIENAHILTMDPANTVTDTLLLQGSKVIAVGKNPAYSCEFLKTLVNSECFRHWKRAPFGIRRLNLEGRTVLPGFVDAHSHFPSSGLISTGLNLSPADGPVTDTVNDLLEKVAAAAEHQPVSQWILGFNYDDALLVDKRHPTRLELDKAAPEHAVYLWHRSGHMGVANTRALRELNLNLLVGENRQDAVSGGFVGRDDIGLLNGLLQEKAAPGLRRLIEEIPVWKLPGVLLSAGNEYLEAGVTTAQNGFADVTITRLLRWAQRLGLIKQRLVVWPAHDKLARVPSVAVSKGSASHGATNRVIGWPEYDREDLAISAMKLIADGSPQGRTAWMSQPYLPFEGGADNYQGIQTLTERKLHELIIRYHRSGLQMAIHGNGDAAIDAIIRGLQKAVLLAPREDARHIIVHAQTIRQEQISALVKLGASASFFPAHTYHWGDWYRHTVFGEKRAAAISPLSSAQRLGLRYSMHSDAPVTAMLPMQIVWSATERLTRSGYRLGATELIGRNQALRALTIDAAWQNFLDDDRGSLEKGKLADFIVLSDNPLTADDVRDISVEQVWIGGNLVYAG